MLINIYTIYDSKAEGYLQPFFSANDGLALRIITDLANDPTHNFCKHASDFTLFKVGTYSDSDATFSILDAKISMATLNELNRELPFDPPLEDSSS